MKLWAFLKGEMGFFEVVDARRSIRRFTNRDIEPKKLKRLLETINRAPSAGNLQAYEVVVVRDQSTKNALMAASLQQEFIASAPIDVVFLANRLRSSVKYRERGANLYCIQDAAVAATIAHYATTALGLGSVWVGAFNETEVARIVRANEYQRPVAILAVGYPAKIPKRTSRRELSDLVREI